MRRLQTFLFLSLLMLSLAPPVLAVLSGYEAPQAAGDSDYSAGLAAFEDADWQGVIDNMAKVIERRPWDDNAHSLMGFAYRKLGDYPRSLEHYQRALDLNPHHRGALAYLGMAYVEMEDLAEAHETLERLELECRRIAGDASKDDWRSDCAEWKELKAAIDAHVKQTEPGSAED